MGKHEAYRYAKSHEWVCHEPGTATVGVSDFAQGEMTDVVYVDLPKPGRKVKLGEACGVVESVKAAFDFYSPVSGEVAAINEALAKDPALVNRSPLADGWFFKVKPDNPRESDSLMDHAKYQEFIKTPAAHGSH